MKNWSKDLEHDSYEHDIELVITDAIQAVAETEQGSFVNLVTPHTFGNPEEYLSKCLMDIFKHTIRLKYIDQCGCGGYVLRVWRV